MKNSDPVIPYAGWHHIGGLPVKWNAESSIELTNDLWRGESTEERRLLINISQIVAVESGAKARKVHMISGQFFSVMESYDKIVSKLHKQGSIP